MLKTLKTHEKCLRALIFNFGFINLSSIEKFAGKLSHLRVKDAIVVDNFVGDSFVCLKRDAKNLAYQILSPYIFEFDKLFWDLFLRQGNKCRMINSFQAFVSGSEARLIIYCTDFRMIIWLDIIQEYTTNDYHIVVSQNYEIEKYLKEKYKNYQNVKVFKPNFIEIQELIKTKSIQQSLMG